jgi:hypothetical protein
MNNYFRKISKFEINNSHLYDEWIKIATKHDLFNRTENFISDEMHTLPNYYKLWINYPLHLDENMDPVGCDSRAGNQLRPPYSFDKLNKDFQGTYTEEVVKKVGTFIKNKYPVYNLTSIKYAVLGPKSLIKAHADISNVPRFFLCVSVLDGCYMEMAGERVPMNEIGALYRMNCNVAHSPINESDGYRVTILFDVQIVSV